MTIAVGDYVKATYEFDGEEASDLPLKQGDIVFITDTPDKNWLSGYVVWNKEVTGNFPSAYVESLVLPSVLTGQKLFLAIEDFPADQAGDLDLVKGDIIVGLKPVSETWWKGKNGPLKGIFPLNFVTELVVQNGPRSRSASARSNSVVISSRESFEVGGALTSVSELLSQKKTVFARALVDVKPQLDGELGFQLGDLLELTDVIDNDWFYGRCHNKEGLVSSVCVEILDAVDDSDAVSEAKPDLIPHTLHHDLASVMGYKENSHGHKLRTLSNGSYTRENTRSHDAEICAYGRVLYPFQAQLSNELSLVESQLVTLIQHMDEDWTEGEVDGHRGIFPTSFIEVIVDCPYAHDCTVAEDSSAEIENTNSCNTFGTETNDVPTILPAQHKNQEPLRKTEEKIESHEIGLVVHTFLAEVSQDVTVSEGDTVEVLRHINDNWLEIQTDRGLKGLVPSNHIDIIGPWPSSYKTNSASAKVLNGHSISAQQDPTQDKSHGKTNLANAGELRKKNVSDLNFIQNPISANYLGIPAEKPVVRAKPIKPSIPPKPALYLQKPILKSSVQETGASNSSQAIGYTQVGTHQSDSTSNESIQQAESTQQQKSAHINLRKKDQLKNLQDSSGSINFRSFADNNLTPSPENRRKSTSLAEQEIFDAFKLSQAATLESKSAFVNKAFQPELDEGVLADVKDRPPPPKRPPKIAPQRPQTAAISNDFFFQALKGPPPRPAGPRLASAPGKSLLVPVKVDLLPKVIPKRPAPKAPHLNNQTSPNHDAGKKPCLQPPRRPPSRPSSFPSPPALTRKGDLMSFSPEQESEPSDANSELILDIKTKLAENQKDIKKYEETRKDLLTKYQTAGSKEEEKEAKDNLDFAENTLSGLREEEKHLKENLFLLVPHEARLEKARLLAAQHAEEEEKRKEEERQRAMELKKKRTEQRGKVIEEIIETEKDFLQSLQLCLETFLDGQKPPSGVDVEFLLGNMEEIADVSQKVLATLETSVFGKSFDEIIIGKCFTQYADDMKNTYAPYCRNHDEVIKAMERYVESPEINEYLAVKVEKMREHMNVFDIAGVLIKPVQRILKYPLLLNELLKNTESEHEDKEEIESAIVAMTDVAKAINEYKRRKDLVYKYKKSTDQTFSDKISKLNLHSIKKKSSRIRGRLSTNFGIALQMRDEHFEVEETKFRNLEKAVKIFLRSVMQFLETSQEVMRGQETVVDDITQFYSGKDSVEARKLQAVVMRLLELYDKMKVTIEKTVIFPLNTLVGLFNGPSHVIEKRFDKLLDYNSKLGKSENDKELQVAKNDYEAMNAQLLDELPKFYTHAFSLLRNCLSAFVLARRDFMDQSLKENCVLLELPSMQSKSSTIETFNIRHTTAFDQMSLLSFIPRGYNPRVDTIKADKAKLRGKLPIDNSTSPINHNTATTSGGQSDGQIQHLQQKYSSDKLFTVISTYNASDVMDISLTVGSIVGVVKELDPMGNKERWFVDDGVNKGFIPCHVLTPYKPSPASSVSMEDDLLSLHSYDSGENIVLSGNDGRVVYYTGGSSLDTALKQQQLTDYQYYALYDFQARHANEASLKAGHPVTVLAFKDLDGNAEWWLVETEDHRGYAPANYMAPMPLS